jgi:hypothetical protein
MKICFLIRVELCSRELMLNRGSHRLCVLVVRQSWFDWSWGTREFPNLTNFKQIPLPHSLQVCFDSPFFISLHGYCCSRVALKQLHGFVFPRSNVVEVTRVTTPCGRKPRQGVVTYSILENPKEEFMSGQIRRQRDEIPNVVKCCRPVCLLGRIH